MNRCPLTSRGHNLFMEENMTMTILRMPIIVGRYPIFIGREAIEIYRDNWMPVYCEDYTTGEIVDFPKYMINYKGQIKQIIKDRYITIYPGKKDMVIMYRDGYSYCVNHEDVIWASLCH
jgi:hypothetical protein